MARSISGGGGYIYVSVLSVKRLKNRIQKKFNNTEHEYLSVVHLQRGVFINILWKMLSRKIIVSRIPRDADMLMVYSYAEKTPTFLHSSVSAI